MVTLLRLIGIFGIFLFAGLFSVTFLSSDTIEKSAKGFVKYQIEKEILKKQQTIKETTVARKAINIAKKLGLESDQIQQKLNDDLPEKIAAVIGSMCGYNCELKKRLASSIESGYINRLNSIKIAQGTLGDLVKGKYLQIIGNLKLDLRIFLGVNSIMFFILLLISFAKPKAVVHLYLPAALLLLATVLSSMIYIFGQNWFYTILYNDYMGLGYLVYIGIIFSMLIDIALNKARVTSGIINTAANAIGSSFSC